MSAKFARITVTGRNKLVQRINELTRDMSGEGRQGARAGIMDALGAGADVLAGQARSIGQAAGVPAEVTDSIFTFRRLPPELKQRKKPSALAGVTKQKTMREWRAGRNPRSSRAKVPPGGKVAMSLAQMFETGTSKMSGTGYWAKAIATSRAQVRATIAAELSELVRRYSL